MKQHRHSTYRWALPPLLVLFLMSMGIGSVFAQAGAVVRSIDVQYAGPKTVSRERILSQMRTQVGQPYSDDVVEEDIRTLYKTGELQNVRIFGEPSGDGVKVTVVVQPRSIVTQIEIAGAQRISARKIRKELKITMNAPVSESTLAEARQKVIDLYRRMGYNDIGVDYRIDTDESHGTSRVIYTINEGEKGAISRVQFEGNAAFSDRTLRHQMKTKPKTIIYFLDKSGRLDETQFQEDLDKIREWYQNHGYVDVEIKDVRKERVNGRMTLLIAVNEGVKYHVGKLRFVGFKQTTEDKIRNILKMKEGAVYSPKGLKDDAKAMADGYGAGGFVDLELRPQSTPAGPGVIDITYNVQEGVRSFVQRINIVGNSRTKDKVIRREVLIAPGDLFSTPRVDITKKRLDNLGYFSKVDTYPQDTDVPGRKDLTIEVEEKRTGALNFGAGFSTIDNLVGFAELTQGNFDLLNWPAFTGGGQKFRAKIQYGTQRKDFLLALTEPYFLDRPLSLGGQLYYSEADFLSSVYSQRNYGFSIDLRKPINPFLAASIDYRLENVELFDVALGISPQLRAELGQGTETKSVVGMTFAWDTRDSAFLTRSGHRVIYSPYVAGGPLGGDSQIWGFDLEASQYFHLWWDNILLLNAEVATVTTWDNSPDVRIYDRLFLGGSNNLRGFNFRDVGPKDHNGEPLGGKSMARATIEYTFPIIEHVRGAFFYDIGLLDSSANQFGTGHTASDAGFGVRLDLPIGPLRIDYGFPLQKDGNGSDGKFNFNVGYQF